MKEADFAEVDRLYDRRRDLISDAVDVTPVEGQDADEVWTVRSVFGGHQIDLTIEQTLEMRVRKRAEIDADLAVIESRLAALGLELEKPAQQIIADELASYAADDDEDEDDATEADEAAA